MQYLREQLSVSAKCLFAPEKTDLGKSIFFEGWEWCIVVLNNPSRTGGGSFYEGFPEGGGPLLGRT